MCDAGRIAEPGSAPATPLAAAVAETRRVVAAQGAGALVIDDLTVGDLAELTSHPVPGVQPSDVPVEEQLRAAVRGLSHAVRDLTWDRGGKKK